MTVVITDNDYKPAEIPDEDRVPAVEVDPNVAAVLPPNAQIKLVTTIGASFWALSKKIETTLGDGEEKAYFLKVYSKELGRRMAIAEFEGGQAVHSILPQNTARPVGKGTYAGDSGKHFLVLEYHDVDDNLPRPSQLAATLAKLHQNSRSPEDKFGFHVGVFGGCQSVDTTWSGNWEHFFTRMFHNALETEITIHGQDDELTQLKEAMFAKVIPRLLRPMETNGRSLRPCLLHGDLWHGNVGVDVSTDEVFIFDFASFYGHNEYDMAPWRAVRYRTDKTYQAAYRSIITPSPPKRDADDRNALYAILNDILVSANWPQTKKTRRLAMDGMKRLIEKFPDGYEGYVEELELDEDEQMRDEVSIDIEVEAAKLDAAETERSQAYSTEGNGDLEEQRDDPKLKVSKGTIEPDLQENGPDAAKEINVEDKSKDAMAQNEAVDPREEKAGTESGLERKAKNGHLGKKSAESEQKGDKGILPLKPPPGDNIKHASETTTITESPSRKGRRDPGSQAGTLKLAWTRAKEMWARNPAWKRRAQS